MKPILRPVNHLVFMVIPHASSLNFVVNSDNFFLLFALQASISLGSQLFPAMKFSRKQER